MTQCQGLAGQSPAPVKTVTEYKLLLEGITLEKPLDSSREVQSGRKNFPQTGEDGKYFDAVLN